MNKRLASLLAAGVFSLAAFQAEAAEKVTLQLKWVTQAQFAGYYVAKDKGFYEEEGLDVDIKPGGPDIAPADLREWLADSTCPVAIINGTSSSGPFLAELSGPRRVVITATKSGHEYNFAHFGDYLSAAIGDSAADLDKDEQTSLLEAYLLAGAKVREFYVDFLGFQIDWGHRFEPGLPLYMQASRAGLTLHLSEHVGDACPGSTVFVQMTGIDELHTELIGKKYKVPPTRHRDRPMERQMYGGDRSVRQPASIQ